MQSNATEPTGALRSLVFSVIDEFAIGFDGVVPSIIVVEMARRIAEAAIEKTIEPEITVDVDGALSFDLRLTDRSLVLAELGIDGSLDGNIYDDQSRLLRRLPKATEAALLEAL